MFGIFFKNRRSRRRKTKLLEEVLQKLDSIGTTLESIASKLDRQVELAQNDQSTVTPRQILNEWMLEEEERRENGNS